MASFEAWLANLFEPLYEVAADPSSHPKLHLFLQQVVAVGLGLGLGSGLGLGLEKGLA